MFKPFNRYDILALAVIAGLATFCWYYAGVDARVEGSALKHIMDTVFGAVGL